MSYIKFLLGYCGWHLRAGWWYLTLGFRLYFAVGLDRDFDPSKKDAVQRSFLCPFPRNYRKHLGKTA